MQFSKALFISALLTTLACPAVTFAENVDAMPYSQNFEKAKVLEVTNQRTQTIPGIDTPSQVQTLKIEVLDGPDKGHVVTFDNDYPTQFSTGDILYVRHETSQLDGTDTWVVSDSYRLNVLIGLVIVFIILVFLFGGIQGVRGLASLVGSVALIFYLLIPGIYNGYSAILVSIGVSSLIIIVGSYITHGLNKTTTAAVFGMIVTVIITGISAYFVVHGADLTGYSSEESVYLNFDTRGKIDMVGLLFGGIMIGLLGVLYDIAIGQAIAVEELFRAGKHLTRSEVYRRAIRIGREHIGALVNTLAIAYVGVALPLLLLIQSSNAGIAFMLNSEIFATEIIRILIGGIGLILGVPITTLIASYMLSNLEGAKTTTGNHGHQH